MKIKIAVGLFLVLIAVALFLYFRFFFSQERINKISRAISTTLGVNGVVELYSGGILVKRFLQVEKLSTAYGTLDKKPRPYRYGFGYVDLNKNGKLDNEEKSKGKSYFEIPEYSTYLYYEKKD
jgi:flagellar basal body-associated protein FliL